MYLKLYALAQFLRRDLYFKAQAAFDAAGNTAQENTQENTHEHFEDAEEEYEATETLSRSFSNLTVKTEQIFKPSTPSSTARFGSPRFESPPSRDASTIIAPSRVASTIITTPRSFGKTTHSQDTMNVDMLGLNEFGTKAELPDAPAYLTFASLDEAKEACDFWYHVDMMHPERTAPHLTVTHCEYQKVGKEKAELVKVCYNHLIDARDYPLCNCWVVCKGHALFVWTPAVPRWQLEDTIHTAVDFNFHQGSPYLEETHTLKFNDIARDANRLIHKTLLIMPEGYVLTGHIQLPLTLDGEKAQGKPCQKELDILAFGKLRKHVLRPVIWVLRNAAASRSFYSLEDKKKESDPFEADMSAGTDFS